MHAPPPPSPEAFPRSLRIRARREYKRTYADGKKRHGRYAVVFFLANGTPDGRLGVTATKKAGGAVARNLLKRRVREIFRRSSCRASGRDVVVNLKREAAGVSFEALREDLTRLFGSEPKR
jgi:ribonuclease P protein component